LDQKYQKQQEKLNAQQDNERQKLQQKQDQEHQRVAQQEGERRENATAGAEASATDSAIAAKACSPTAALAATAAVRGPVSACERVAIILSLNWGSIRKLADVPSCEIPGRIFFIAVRIGTTLATNMTTLGRTNNER
jgi:hypothetical protein